MGTAVPSYDAWMVGTVWSKQQAACTASARRASVDHTVRMWTGVHCLAKMEEHASKTHSTNISTAANVPCTSLDDTARSKCQTKHIWQSVLTCGVRNIQVIRYVMISATTMRASGMEETVPSTGNSLGLTVLQMFLAGTSSRMDIVIRSVTILGVSLTVLNALRSHRQFASKLHSCHLTFLFTYSQITYSIVYFQIWQVLCRSLW